VVAARRKGKYMWVELDGEGEHKDIMFHMGMTGSLHFKGLDVPQYRSFSVSTDWPPKFCKAQVVFEGGMRLAYTDPRRWGRIQVSQSVSQSVVR
jgi:formamidopyrimidine-DNA glycosylase